MSQDMASLKFRIQSHEVSNELRRIVSSVEGFDVLMPDNPEPVDLLILELGTDPRKDLELIQSLLTLGTVGEVFLTSNNSDPSLVVQSMRVGAREFFLWPINGEEVRQALLRFKERRSKPTGEQGAKAAKIVDLVGVKGGVGTTTIAVNLADSLARTQGSPSVALLDMNVLFGEVTLFLDIKSDFHWGEIARNIDRLDATFLMSILSRHSSGLYVLPSPSYLNGSDVAKPEAIQRLLGLMRTMFDFVVIDGGQHLDDASLRILELSDVVFLISVLTLPCFANAHRLLKSFYGLGHSQERAAVIVNRYVKNPDVSLEDAEESINKRIVITIPNDYRTTMSAINQGKTLSEVAPNSRIVRSLQELAKNLAHRQENKEKKGGLLSSLFNGSR